ncbi:MAG: general glycosylation pathway protein [candidate division Zixibacteria bacterium SM23_81]|nr:MAG: general glycosylation pathway protein [candidate division Zixibacteria bacterium SM23_81]
MEIQVPYGQHDVLSVRLDEERVAGVVHPNKVTVGDENKTLEEALSHPINSKSFDQFLEDARDVLFIVNDATRPTPTAKILEILAPRLIGREVNFLIATGIHRAPTPEEYHQIFGEMYSKYSDRIVAHDAKRDEDMVFIGKSKNGTEMYVNRMGMDAHKIVIIGSVEPHYFAGYTGGRKAFLPGIASYKTIEQNHKFALKMEAQALALEGNPVHEDMIDALKTIEDKEIFAIMTVLDSEHRIYAATAGHIHDSFQAAIEKANEVFAVKIGSKADVVVTVAPFPMDVDLYQAQKALDNGKLALNDGGLLILVAKCRTGVGHETFARLLNSSESPQDALDQIEREYKLGYHKAAKMAEIGLWAQMCGVCDLEDSVLEGCFLKPYHDLQEAIDQALEEKGPDAKVLFLMAGSLTVPIV